MRVCACVCAQLISSFFSSPADPGYSLVGWDSNFCFRYCRHGKCSWRILVNSGPWVPNYLATAGGPGFLGPLVLVSHLLGQNNVAFIVLI